MSDSRAFDCLQHFSFTASTLSHQSTAKSWPDCSKISGARYSGVPQIVYARFFFLSSCVANPRSARRRYPCASRSKFSGLRSLRQQCVWVISWQLSTPLRHADPTHALHSTSRQCRAGAENRGLAPRRRRRRGPPPRSTAPLDSARQCIAINNRLN